MDQPSYDVYELEKGMDAHNLTMREIRSHNQRTYDSKSPTRIWIDEDNTPSGIYKSLTIILNTGGCRWARAGGCTMCGYVAESVAGGSVSHEDLLAQIQVALDYEKQKNIHCGQIKIYTSGSFFDEREIPPTTREEIAKIFSNRDRIVIESLPDFVTEQKISDFTNMDLSVDIAIGLETASDRIRHDCINKYFTFEDFIAASTIANQAGAGIKAYLLLKPPFLSEVEAITDMIDSIDQVSPYAHTISMNPSNVQRHTLVEQLYFSHGYRPPWLWSISSILRETAKTNIIVVSDPVGAGSDRGPHNCGSCDDIVFRSIKDFNLRQDPSVLSEPSCDCQETWKFILENETGYNLPLLH
tara:strand:- start:11027 stop:12094 length:1068 start_codon:yes stop_codon:yes gene_type:complete